MRLLDRNVGNGARFCLALTAWMGSGLMMPALALECPSPQMQASQGALREPPKVLAARSTTLKARGSAAISGLIFQIRKSNPGSTDAEITNYLITVYCPVVNKRPGLTEEQKKQDLTRFAGQVCRQLP